jgi:hypothetical protein
MICAFFPLPLNTRAPIFGTQPQLHALKRFNEIRRMPDIKREHVVSPLPHVRLMVERENG